MKKGTGDVSDRLRCAWTSEGEIWGRVELILCGFI